MPLIRTALPLLATIALFSPAEAAHATSKLTPTPPPTFTAPLPRVQTSRTTPSTDAVPRTGTDLEQEMLAAGILIAAGTALRTRRLSGRS
jgi:hypothetical protein